jgi:hypothetical protein
MMPAFSVFGRWLALATVVALAPAPAPADIYRCTIDGRLTFRDAPCPTEAAPPPGTPIRLGCYLVDSPGWESGRQSFILKISSTGHDKYQMTEPADAGKSTLAMRRATPDELRAVGTLLHFASDSAVVLDVAKGTPNMPAVPIGLYRGQNQYRDATYLFFGFLANGLARAVPCP